MNTQPTENRIGIVILYILSDLFLILSAVLLAHFGSLSGVFAALAQYSWVVLLFGGLAISIVGILSKKAYANARAVFLHGLFVILFGFWFGVVRHPMLVEKPPVDVATLFDFGTICLMIVTIFLQLDLLFSDRLRHFLTTDKKQTESAQDNNWEIPEIPETRKRTPVSENKKSAARERKEPSMDATDSLWTAPKPSKESLSDTPESDELSLFDDDDYSERIAARVAARARARSAEAAQRRRNYDKPLEESDELFFNAVNRSDKALNSEGLFFKQ